LKILVFVTIFLSLKRKENDENKKKQKVRETEKNKKKMGSRQSAVVHPEEHTSTHWFCELPKIHPGLTHKPRRGRRTIAGIRRRSNRH
jgi:hypothetical protein